jgi:hypothetical protein
MSLLSLEMFINESEQEQSIKLLKNKVSITEKISGHRVYCKKERNGNVLFYSKKKSTPITVLDRLLSDMYEPFIKHIISKKDKLQLGEYGFYLINDPIDITYSKKPMNNLLLTNIPLKSKKSCIETAIELEVSYAPPVFQGILKDEQILMIIDYVKNGGHLVKLFNMMFDKCCTALCATNNTDEVIEGFVFSFGELGTYKLNDNLFKRNEFQKSNTASYELLLIEIFDFVKNQDFSTVKFQTTNEHMKRAEFAFEMFNRFIDYHTINTSLNNLLLNPPPFIYTKGKLNKKYVCNKKTFELLTNDKMEYLLRIFITTLKDIQKPRGIISEQMAEENNYTILKISEYIKKSNELLDYKDFKKFAGND